ncbi:MAG: siphovirus ReqiPepy6 Gp37-like family protein [Solobacterium sp.]|jgi:hypothetical protein|nr:siphovirus ReqiPepy6 Gp37-like family protein [Solobacterium sp.]
MEIKIYGADLFRRGQIDNATSLLWNRKFYEPGNFEMHVPITDENLALLAAGNIVTKAGSKEAGVIEDIQKEDSATKRELTIKGRFLSSYMDRRLIKGIYNFSGKTEVAMRTLLSNATAIPLVELGALNGYTDTVEFQATYKNLLTYEEKLSISSNIGFRFYPDFDNKKILFQTYKGTDHSYSQTTNARVIFSELYSNLENATYKFNNQLLRTYAVIGGDGEGTSRTYVTIGSGEGLELRELFVDAKDIQRGDLTDAQYTAALIQRGNEKLAENIESESFEADVNPSINFTYKTDYDLGDIVTIEKKKWDLRINKRITEIQEVYEHENMYIVPTFGDPLPESIDWSE